MEGCEKRIMNDPKIFSIENGERIEDWIGTMKENIIETAKGQV